MASRAANYAAYAANVKRRRRRIEGGGFSPEAVSPLIWYDPSDLTTLFQLSNGTTAVTADADPVGYAGDKSGNARHWLQATAGSRPLYKTSGGLHWLDFDGTKSLATAALTLPAGCTAVLALQTTDATFVTLSKGVSAAPYIGTAQDGSALDVDSAAGTPAYHINGGAAIARTRDAYHDAVSTGAAVVVEIRNVDMSGFNAALRIGNYTGFEYTGRLYGLVIATEANVAANRQALLDYMAAKAGVTL